MLCVTQLFVCNQIMTCEKVFLFIMFKLTIFYMLNTQMRSDNRNSIICYKTGIVPLYAS